MYKAVLRDIKKINLDKDLYKLHNNESVKSDFGMNDTSELLDEGFGLYSTVNLNHAIGPVKTQYFRIALTKKGTANFGLGLEKYTARCNTILFGFPGQVFSLIDFNEDFLAYYMLFTETFVGERFGIQNRNQQFPFLSHSGLQCFSIDDRSADEIEGIITKMNTEIKERRLGCSEMIKLYISQVLLIANRCYGTVMLSGKDKSNTLQVLYNEFLRSVSQHFLTERRVAAYAAMLHVSADHLNRAIRACSDKTAHELIDDMLLMEAKSYLLYSKLSISEIAYKLEFTDPSHFNRFFKKYNDITPLQYRNQS